MMCFCTPSIRTPFCGNCNQAMFLRINELKQQRDELQRDAERYRWLRENPTWIGYDADYRSDEIDAAIDAAISKMKEQT